MSDFQALGNANWDFRLPLTWMTHRGVEGIREESPSASWKLRMTIAGAKTSYLHRQVSYFADFHMASSVLEKYRR